MSTIKLYIYNDESSKGDGVGFEESGKYIFTETRNHEYTTEPDTNGKSSTYETTNVLTSTIYVDLEKLSFTKKMYEPGVITATLLVTGMAKDAITVKKDGTTIDTVTDTENTDTTQTHEKGMLRNRVVTSELIKKLFVNAKVELTVNGKSVASNYFVYSAQPHHKKDSLSKVSMDLTIYSEDKLMTI